MFLLLEIFLEQGGVEFPAILLGGTRRSVIPEICYFGWRVGNKCRLFNRPPLRCPLSLSSGEDWRNHISWVVLERLHTESTFPKIVFTDLYPGKAEKWAWFSGLPVVYMQMSEMFVCSFFKCLLKNICILFIYLALLGLSCILWVLWLQPVASSSLVRDWTWGPLYWEHSLSHWTTSEVPAKLSCFSRVRLCVIP